MARKQALSSKDPAESGVRSCGHEVGHKWARGQASAPEVARLRALVGDRGEDALQHLHHAAPSPYRAADYLAFAVLGLEPTEYNYVSANDFWAQVYAEGCVDETRSDEFLWGFIEGALEVQDVVADYGVSALDFDASGNG